MPDCDENMALHYIMQKQSRHKHNRWLHQSSP